MKLRILLLACFVALSAIAQAPSTAPGKKPVKPDVDKEIKLGEDEAGCKESALMPRLAGCSIIQCDTKEADTLEIYVGASTDGAVQKEAMDGPSEVLYYLCPSKLSLANIVKNSEAALLKAGFKQVYNGKDDDEQPVVTLLKGTQWVQISTYMYNDYSAYVQSVIAVTPDVSSEALSDEMAKNGRVVLYGIAFEKEKSVLSQDAEKLLSEVAAFLVRQPELKIRVEGYTDESADKTVNVTVSKQRASSVASWLLEHGIDKSRITIDGMGDSKPDVSGDRSKNQRVEIAKI
jgi:outer membrane protein OmpA-like peptidoglycan-associated protein